MPASTRPLDVALDRPGRPALRVVPAPERNAAQSSQQHEDAPRVGAHLPLEWSLPGGLPAEPTAPPRLRLVVSTPAPAATRPANPEPESGPLPAQWVARLARAVIEVASGERPAAQLSRWTSRDVYDHLARRAACASRHPAVAGRPPQCRRVTSVRVQAITPTVVEACAVVSGRTRSRAVALRLERRGDRWVATAVELR